MIKKLVFIFVLLFTVIFVTEKVYNANPLEEQGAILYLSSSDFFITADNVIKVTSPTEYWYFNYYTQKVSTFNYKYLNIDIPINLPNEGLNTYRFRISWFNQSGSLIYNSTVSVSGFGQNVEIKNKQFSIPDGAVSFSFSAFYESYIEITTTIRNNFVYSFNSADKGVFLIKEGLILTKDTISSFADYYYNKGYDIGFEYGFGDGYYEGLNDNLETSGFSMLMASMWGGVKSFMAIELLPNITIGSFVLVPLVFGIVMFIIGRKKE